MLQGSKTGSYVLSNIVRILQTNKIKIYTVGFENKERTHYENTPIQIYRKFHLQKLKLFR